MVGAAVDDPRLTKVLSSSTGPSDHSMTRSALNSSDVGIVRLSALAVLRVTTNSNLTGCSTGDHWVLRL
jgi:hypothetical protein